MAIPSLSSCGLADPCCIDLFAIGKYLLDHGVEALNCCVTGDCDPVAAYVTLGSGDDGITDALTVAVIGVNPSPANRPGSPGLHKASFEVRLRESGWPTAYVDGDSIMLPDPALQLEAAKYMLARGEALHRKYAHLYGVRQLAPSPVVCTGGSLGTLSPLNPQGGVVGWVIPITIDLPWT